MTIIDEAWVPLEDLLIKTFNRIVEDPDFKAQVIDLQSKLPQDEILQLQFWYKTGQVFEVHLFLCLYN